MDKNHQPPTPAELHWVKKGNWAGDDEVITGDELLGFVDRKLFPTLRIVDVRT